MGCVSLTSRPLIFTAYLGICTIAAIFIGYYATWALLGLFAMGWLTDAVDKRAKPVELKGTSRALGRANRRHRITNERTSQPHWPPSMPM